MWEEEGLIAFLRRFDESPFCVKTEKGIFTIGEGKPAFTVKIHGEIPLKELVTSTSLALGEAYMDGRLGIPSDGGRQEI